MIPLQHSVTIEKPVHDVYALAREVERYPEFLPGYVESRILEKRDDQTLLLRKAIVRGTLHEWQSWVRFQPDEAIDFEHAAGPLQGMRVRWSFTPLPNQQTQLVIRHEVNVRRKGLLGWMLEKWFFAPRINEIADQVILAFKHAAECGIRL
jgi:ribosome-associated toxin RatA of RatAB toxin-antitoxin module